jgi:hypothetical protein
VLHVEVSLLDMRVRSAADHRVDRDVRKKPTAIVDTNTVLNVISCHDLIDPDQKTERYAWYRLDRAAYGLRMAIYFHETNAFTLSAGDETLDLATRLVPPEDNDIAGWYLRLWFYFTHRKLLRRWNTGSAAVSGTGSRVDAALMDLAREHACPLITNEGIGPDGPTARKGIRTAAALTPVQVMTSEEFCGRFPLSRTRMKRFLREFARLGPHFYRGHRLYFDLQRFMRDVHTFYVGLLLGSEPSAVAERRRREATDTLDDIRSHARRWRGTAR